MNPNNIRIRIRSRKHYSLTSGFKHPWKRKSHLSLLPIIIYIPIFHADLTIPGTSGCFSRSIPFSKMAQRIISAADCQIYCDICKYTSGNAHFDSLIDACNKINVSKKNVWSYKQSISDVILACQCHKYSTKDLWTKILPQYPSTFPVPVTKATPDWQPWQITCCKSPAFTCLPIGEFYRIIQSAKPATDLFLICFKTYISNWCLINWIIFKNLNFTEVTIKYKKEFSKWLKWDNSIKCCHRTSLACGKKNRVWKDPPSRYRVSIGVLSTSISTLKI